MKSTNCLFSICLTKDMDNVQCISSTFGSQKLLIPFNEVSSVKSLDCVQIDTKKGTYICKVHRTNLAKSDAILENTVQVYEKRHKAIIKKPKLSEKLNLIKLVSQPATQIKVTVVTNSFEGAVALRKIKIAALLKSLLSHVTFVQLSAINSKLWCPAGDISRILILETLPENQAVFTNSKTKITVESIITEKWLCHQEQISCVRLGGLDQIYNKLKELVMYTLQFPQVFSKLPAPKGILLHGPPGCGKSSIIHQLCDEFGLYLLTVTCSDLTSSQPGENEKKLRLIFKETIENAQDNSTVLFLDGIDAICPKRGGHSHTSRLVTCLLSMIDEVNSNLNIMIVAATSRPEDVDPALRRSGRLDREIYFSVPNAAQRLEILKVLCQNMKLESQLDLEQVADLTPGYVGADLNLLRHETAYLSQDRGYSTLSDWKVVLKNMRPSVMRQGKGNGEFRKVSWEAIGGLEEAKTCIRRSIEWPWKHPEAFHNLNVPMPKGVLIYGPPGCGKSLLVRAAATCCAASFFSISAAELFSPFVGDSERMISSLFERARLATPAILFLDELDAMVGGRSHSTTGRTAQQGVITNLLQEMDGIFASQGIVVVGATNRPDKIDGALLRPGRFDSLVYIPNPDEKERLAILKAVSSKMPLDDVDLELVAQETALFSGADLESLIKETAIIALEEDLKAIKISQHHFMEALKRVPPSLTAQQMKYYEDYQKLKKSSVLKL